jgi:GntR family transcriptional regulator, histidine utilization repressor
VTQDRDAAADQPDAEPLHRRIRREIETRIVSGEWPPGTRIPFEHELMAQFGCARMTVNKAISSLAAIGLIERRRKRGSFVARQRMQSAVLEIPDIAAEVTRRGERYGYELLACRQRAATAEDPIGRAGPRQVLELTCRHNASDQPLALEHRLISLAAVPEAAEADFSAAPPGTWLVEHVPWTEAEHRITAVNAAPAVAAQLGVPRNTACLVVERQTWRAGIAITFVRQVFRADLYHLVARFTPGESGDARLRHFPSRSAAA